MQPLGDPKTAETLPELPSRVIPAEDIEAVLAALAAFVGPVVSVEQGRWEVNGG